MTNKRKNRTRKTATQLVIMILLCVIAASYIFATSREKLRKQKPEEQDITNQTAPLVEATIDDSCTILFASDYQGMSDFDEPAETLRKLSKAAVSDGKQIDAVILGGDYTNDAILHDYQLSPEGSLDEIKGILHEEISGLQDGNITIVQGNHDKLTESISQSGLHEYDDYLVYVLNTENDFPWKQGKTAGCHEKVKDASARMKECFDGLIAAGETRPVIIAGHVPLHFTARTSSRHTTGDNLYSTLIFGVVNEAAQSLDIIYLYGHNHSKGWDCYMGGAAVYKAPGDELLLPLFQDSAVNTDEFTVEKLNFTYMNAGYVGYYMNCAPGEDAAQYMAADDTLTVTICEIYKDRIEITRYDENGRHVLGAAGATNPYKGGIDKGLIGSEHFSKEVSSPALINRKPGTDQIDEAA